MTHWEFLSLTAGAAWPLAALAIGRHWGTLGILIGLLAGSFIGVGAFWGTLRAGHWLIDRLELDQPSPRLFKLALSWLLLLAAFAWIVISCGLAATIMRSLFVRYLPAPSRAPWEVTIAAGVGYFAQHPALAVFVTLIFCVMVLLLWFLIFDRLLRIHFSEAHSDWERQGCMSGYFWSPPGCRETSMRDRGNLLGDWLVDPPYWLRARASFWRPVGLATMVALVAAVMSLILSLMLLVAHFLP